MPYHRFQKILLILKYLNINGLQLSKSSQPILANFGIRIGVPNVKKVFVMCIYYGTQKPTDLNEFLGKFINEVKLLCKEGIIINNKNIPCTIDSIICDAPAKAFILKVKGHNDYFSCTICITEGNYINGKICFSEINAQLRTDADFRLRKDENYHVGYSILLEISNFDLL